jgi:hypothetical protein
MSGAGYLNLSGSGTNGDARIQGLSSTGTIAVGGTMSRGFVVAGALSSASLMSPDFKGYPTNQQRGWTPVRSGFGILFDWFPDDHRGWHVGGTLGLDILALKNDAANISWAGFGFGAAALGGYDFWIGPEWSLGILAKLSGGSSASLKDANSNANGADTGYGLGSFAFSIEGGLIYH